MTNEFLSQLIDPARIGADVQTVYRVLDVSGVFLMGIVGGTIARQKGYDIIGFLFLALFSALGGGMTRDALIQQGTVAALSSPEYLLLAFAGATIAWLVMFRGKAWEIFEAHADAVISASWAVTGATKALNAGLPMIAALFLGVITATGGGMIRDVVTGSSPRAFGGHNLVVLPAVLAALVTSGFYYAGQQILGMILGLVAGALLSIAAYWFDWRLDTDPEFAPVNMTARQLRSLVRQAADRSFELGRRFEPRATREWRYSRNWVHRKADAPGEAGEPVPEEAALPVAGEEYRLEDVLRALNSDETEEGRRNEHEFVTAWLAWQDDRRKSSGR